MSELHAEMCDELSLLVTDIAVISVELGVDADTLMAMVVDALDKATQKK
jgi:hypothetical protein